MGIFRSCIQLCRIFFFYFLIFLFLFPSLPLAMAGNTIKDSESSKKDSEQDEFDSAFNPELFVVPFDIDDDKEDDENGKNNGENDDKSRSKTKVGKQTRFKNDLSDEMMSESLFEADANESAAPAASRFSFRGLSTLDVNWSSMLFGAVTAGFVLLLSAKRAAHRNGGILRAGEAPCSGRAPGTKVALFGPNADPIKKVFTASNC